MMLAAVLVLLHSPWPDAHKTPERNFGAPGETVQCKRGPCCIDLASFPYLLGPKKWADAWRSLKDGEELTVPDDHAVRLCVNRS
jgi:hypothetical protein